MTDDIVERLRRINGWTNEPDASPMEAADEIELLRDTLQRHAGDVKDAMQEIERLREQVEMVMSINHQQGDKIERLLAALGEKT